MSKKIKLLILASLMLVLFVIGVLVGQFSQAYRISKLSFISSSRSQLVDYNQYNLNPLKNLLKDYFSNLATDSSFYFEYLPLSVPIAINKNNELIAASLMKLPVVMDIYKLIEEGALDSNQELEIDNLTLDTNFGNLLNLETDGILTVGQAISYSLSYSDNTSTIMLQNLLLKHENSLQYSSMQTVDFTVVETLDQENRPVNRVGAREYARFFKCLYDACYLTQENSNKILETLASTGLNERIPKKLPPDIPVAHKIGTHWEIAQSDCGIIYYPRRPYLLCVLVSADEERGNQIIATVSKLVYDYIDNLSN